MKKLQQGRSMIEMLGVLAIIGVLSIGGLAGYTMAMNRHRANTILDYVSRCVVVAQTNGDGSYLTTGACKDILGEEKPTFLETDASITTTAGGGDITVEGDAATSAIADALRNRSTDAIEITGSAKDFTITFNDAGKGFTSVKAAKTTGTEG